MALIGTPNFPTTSSRTVITTAAWSGLGRRHPIAPLLPGPIVFWPSISGAEIIASGQYEFTFNFTVSGITTGIQIRSNVTGADGEGVPVDFTLDGSASYKGFANVTDSDILAGQVFLLIESASRLGTENITWDHAELSIRRIGSAI